MCASRVDEDAKPRRRAAVRSGCYRMQAIAARTGPDHDLALAAAIRTEGQVDAVRPCSAAQRRRLNAGDFKGGLEWLAEMECHVGVGLMRHLENKGGSSRRP